MFFTCARPSPRFRGTSRCHPAAEPDYPNATCGGRVVRLGLPTTRSGKSPPFPGLGRAQVFAKVFAVDEQFGEYFGERPTAVAPPVLSDAGAVLDRDWRPPCGRSARRARSASRALPSCSRGCSAAASRDSCCPAGEALVARIGADIVAPLTVRNDQVRWRHGANEALGGKRAMPGPSWRGAQDEPGRRDEGVEVNTLGSLTARPRRTTIRVCSSLDRSLRWRVCSR
jgi:hypothetical protein